MGFMVLQWFVIGTELLTIRTQISSAVHMLGLNMLIKVCFMPGRVLTIQTDPATIRILLHPRQDLVVSVFPSIIFKKDTEWKTANWFLFNVYGNVWNDFCRRREFYRIVHRQSSYNLGTGHAEEGRFHLNQWRFLLATTLSDFSISLDKIK